MSLHTGKKVEFTVPARYYQRLEGREIVKSVSLTTANSAIVCIHPENSGYPGGPHSVGEKGTVDYYDLWDKRYKPVVEKTLVPLFATARESGLGIMYLLPGWKAVEKYPQYQELKSRVKQLEPSTWQPPPSPHPEWMTEAGEDAFGKGFSEVGECDVAPPLAVQPQDWVAYWDREASTLFHERGIWNIFFTGFEAASCLINLGLLDLYRFGYRCFIVEDGSLGLETRQTRPNQEMQKRFFQAMQFNGYAYLVNSTDIIAALKKGTGENI